MGPPKRSISNCSPCFTDPTLADMGKMTSESRVRSGRENKIRGYVYEFG